MDSKLNILIVEDNDDLREATADALQAMGHRVHAMDCAEGVDEAVSAFAPDLYLLDLNLPGEGGISLSRRLRAAHPDAGIIMITARSKANDIAVGYDSGADIYLSKPTTFEALAAALQALSRRIKPSSAHADVTIIPATRQLKGPLAKVNLSSTEVRLLIAFAQAEQHILENWQLIEMSGKAADFAAKSALEVQIVRLRKKLEEAGSPTPTIKAIRGTGYQLCISIEVRDH